MPVREGSVGGTAACSSCSLVLPSAALPSVCVAKSFGDSSLLPGLLGLGRTAPWTALGRSASARGAAGLILARPARPEILSCLLGVLLRYRMHLKWKAGPNPLRRNLPLPFFFLSLFFFKHETFKSLLHACWACNFELIDKARNFRLC